MPRTTKHHTTSSASPRNPADDGATLLGLGGEAAVAAAALAPDAELLAICTLARAIDARSAAACAAVEHLRSSDPLSVATYKQSCREMATYHALVERAGHVPARTPEGLRAKAELALAYLAANDDPEIAMSLARDVAGRA